MLKTASSKINLGAGILALAALILAIVSHVMTEANALIGLSDAVAGGMAATALCLVAAFSKSEILGLLCSLGSIATNMFLLNIVVSERILLFAGIFSYDSGNVDGWNVFYVVVASCVCVVLSCVATMVSGFVKK